ELKGHMDDLDDILTILKNNLSEANVSALKEDINVISEDIRGVGDNLGDLGISYVNCTNVVDQIKGYINLFGVINMTVEDPCDFINDEVNEFIYTGINEAIRGNLSELNASLQDLSDSLDEEDVDELVDTLEGIQCTLRGVNVKLDRFISYMQLSVREDSTFMDLLPPDVSMETKTVTETIGEALYVEDRLAQSDYGRVAAAIGVRVGFQVAGMGLNNSKNQLGQAIALTLTRKDYKAAARDSVKESLNILLSEQGYDYCFTAETCCDRLEAGSCLSIPDNFGLARQGFRTTDGETGEMSLHIWRK
ncbi:MAG: hypothetical protein U9Q22_06805, partial [Candidatus Altiarchaeota archaeon]|nr:hypothetical protein [Candidatus Altiarchaeota archaeon]